MSAAVGLWCEPCQHFTPRWHWEGVAPFCSSCGGEEGTGPKVGEDRIVLVARG